MTFVFILTSLGIFGLIHSLLAGRDVKGRFHAWLGERRYEAFYRFGYNVLAGIMLLPVGAALLLAPGEIIWQVDSPLLALVMNAIRLAGALGLLVSLLQIDLMRFVGLAQVRAYIQGEPLPLPDEPLQTGGFYSRVRHPLYFFSLLALWPAATMTEALLALNIGSTAYFIIGSLFEEKRLLRTFGSQYADYKRRVPWMFPRFRRRSHI